MNWLYMLLGVSLAIWVLLSMYVFSEIKRVYDKAGLFSKKLLNVWLVMWAFHHLPIIISSFYGVWLLPLNKTGTLLGGLLMIGAGFIIVAVGMRELSIRRSCGEDTSKLVTTSIYRYSRNPQFVGWFLILLGISLAGRSGFALMLTAVFAIVIHLYTIKLEEPYLERIFGDEYLRYKESSPRYFGFPKKSHRGASNEAE
jgi:protein-S-isoprenylcysteine O-methyltransferase Ste14